MCVAAVVAESDEFGGEFGKYPGKRLHTSQIFKGKPNPLGFRQADKAFYTHKPKICD